LLGLPGQLGKILHRAFERGEIERHSWRGQLGASLEVVRDASEPDESRAPLKLLALRRERREGRVPRIGRARKNFGPLGEIEGKVSDEQRALVTRGGILAAKSGRRVHSRSLAHAGFFLSAIPVDTCRRLNANALPG
jgi:hypothetical protein